MAERETPQSHNVLGEIATSLHKLRQPIFSGDDVYSRYYITDTGAQVYRAIRRLPELVTNPKAVDDLNAQLKPNAELARDVLRGIESPKKELQKEMQYVAERLSSLVPQQAPDAHLRRRDQKELEAQQTNAFGEGMVSLLEELINGRNANGELTHAVILHRIARHAMTRLSPAVMDIAFARGQDGLLHFNKSELSAVKGLRERRAVAGAINLATGGLLKEGEEPVSAYRGVKAVAGKIGRGLLGAYIRLEGMDESSRKKAAAAQKWLNDHDGAFDPKIARALGWGEKANANVRQMSDILQFTQYEMPHHISRAINAVPNDEQLTKIGDVIKAAVALGVTGLSPLLELSALNASRK